MFSKCFNVCVWFGVMGGWVCPWDAAGEREMRGLTENRKKPTDGRSVENVAVRHRWFDDAIIDACLGPKGEQSFSLFIREKKTFTQVL